MPEVRPATDADIPAIGRALAAAFDGDPVWSWITGPRADWAARAPAWFEAEARNQLHGHGEVLVDDQVRGAAIWAPPGRWKASPSDAVPLALPSIRLFGRRLPRSLRAITLLERHHPRNEHWYLAILGTDPAHQGSGVGSALIEAVTSRCDEEGLPAYLESSKERNLAFYARHGFEVLEEIQLPKGPMQWTMWRNPRG